MAAKSERWLTRKQGGLPGARRPPDDDRSGRRRTELAAVVFAVRVPCASFGPARTARWNAGTRRSSGCRARGRGAGPPPRLGGSRAAPGAWKCPKGSRGPAGCQVEKAKPPRKGNAIPDSSASASTSASAAAAAAAAAAALPRKHQAQPSFICQVARKVGHG
jgi:hypothetical protein